MQIVKGKATIPDQWAVAKLSNVAQINPRYLDRKVSDDTEITFLPMKQVEEMTGRYDASLVRKYVEVKKGYTPIQNGDLIFAKITPCMENGKIALLDDLKNGVGYGSTEFHVIRLSSNELSKKFYFYFLLQNRIRREAKRNMTGSAGQLRVPVSFLETLHVPIPPANEQKRIVSKIEELFTKLDAGIEYLKNARMELKRYKQSVLKAAFEGKITEKWRTRYGNQTENASSFLELLKSTCKSGGMEALLAGTEANPPYALPDKWVWTTLSALLSDARYGTSVKCDYETRGTPVLRIPNINNGRINVSDLKYGQIDEKELSKLSVSKGDLLVIRTNGSHDLVGTCALVGELKTKFAFASYLIRLRPSADDTLPVYLNYYFQTQKVRSFIQSKARTTAGQFNVNLAALGSIPVPLAPISEQSKIVQAIDEAMSVIDNTAATAETILSQSDQLRQSLLRQAFQGDLVAQDPDDEPATKLLERIAQHIGKPTQIISHVS